MADIVHPSTQTASSDSAQLPHEVTTTAAPPEQQQEHLEQSPEAASSSLPAAREEAAKDETKEETAIVHPVTTTAEEQGAPEANNTAPSAATADNQDVEPQSLSLDSAAPPAAAVEKITPQEETAADSDSINPPSPSPAQPQPSQSSVCTITLLLPTGARHPYKIDEKYLSKRGVEIPEPGDPFSVSVYKLKELILREWRDEWDGKPASPSSIRLIHFGKLLDDKEMLKSEFAPPPLPPFINIQLGWIFCLMETHMCLCEIRANI